MDTSVEAVEERPNEVKPKMHFTGKVVKTTLAGAAIDIGVGKPAVMHISQIAGENPAEPIKSVNDVLQVGQEVEVWVKKVKDDRIELTMIKPLDLEWRDIKKGMVVKGKVTRLEKFGAFVEIGAERPGLIHISEMAHGYVRTPSEVVNEGDEVEAEVLDVNRRKRQIKLSMKALQEEPVKEEAPTRVLPDFSAPRTAPARRPKKTGRSDDRRSYNVDEIPDALMEADKPAEADPTAMEMALREAMEKAKIRKAEKGKKKTAVSQEQEDLLSRTLENKVRTS